MGFESDLLKGNNLRHTTGYSDDVLSFFFQIQQIQFKSGICQMLTLEHIFSNSRKHVCAINTPINLTFL